MRFDEILLNAATLMNDALQTEYDNETLLPMLNMAMTDLKEIFELNNIPVTNETSETLTIPAGTTRIAFTGTTPTLPSDLIEIRQIFESVVDQDLWIPVVRKNYLTGIILPPIQIVNFGVWAWINQEIRVPSLINDQDLKLDYIRNIFTPVDADTISAENTVINSDSFLYNRTAALASRFLAENETRADKLDEMAGMSLGRSLGISVKGMQSIMIRRRPFRASFKRSRRYI